MLPGACLFEALVSQAKVAAFFEIQVDVPVLWFGSKVGYSFDLHSI
jgi:hypothetical protein